MVLKALPPAGRSGGEVLPGELGGPVTRRSVVGRDAVMASGAPIRRGMTESGWRGWSFVNEFWG